MIGTKSFHSKRNPINGLQTVFLKINRQFMNFLKRFWGLLDVSALKQRKNSIQTAEKPFCYYSYWRFCPNGLNFSLLSQKMLENYLKISFNSLNCFKTYTVYYTGLRNAVTASTNHIKNKRKDENIYHFTLFE